MWKERLSTLLITLTLAGCQQAAPILNSVTSVFGTEPPPPPIASVVNILCTQNGEGAYVFGKVLPSHADTLETQAALIERNAAWDAATEEGALCRP